MSKRLIISCLLVTAFLLFLGAKALLAEKASLKPISSPMISPEVVVQSAGENVLIRERTRGYFTPEVYEQPTQISFNGFTFDTRVGEPELPSELKISSLKGGINYYLVQFRGPITRERENLEKLGAKVYGYVPNYAFLVRMNESSKRGVENLSSFCWMGLFQPAYKLVPFFFTQTKRKAAGSVDVNLILFYDEGNIKLISDKIKELGGGVYYATDSGLNKIITARVDYVNLATLANIPEVEWIEPATLNQFIYNDKAQWCLQTNNSGVRTVWDKGIKGEGQILSTCDTGIRTTHNMFYDAAHKYQTWADSLQPAHRKLIAYLNSMAGTPYPDSVTMGDEDGHGTHTGCTCVGEDSYNSGTSAYDGMSINAKHVIVDAQGNSGLWIPNDQNILFWKVYNREARIMSNSWGNVPQNATDADSVKAGNYLSSAMTSDQFHWKYRDFLNFQAAGNNGNTGSGGYEAKKVASASCAKNAITVGSVKAPTSQATYEAYSARDTDDNRYKPDVLGIGTLNSAINSGDANYGSKSGTSMATPSVAGTAGLLRQYITEGWYPSGTKVSANAFTPTSALLKALVINSGDNNISSHTVPDSAVGWGRICADTVLYFSGDTKMLGLVDNTVGLLTGEYVDYQFRVSDAAKPVKVTLVWTDYPAVENANPTLVNDLDLEVTDPSSNVYKGNVYSSGESATGGSADVRNNVENVRRNAPGTGVWTARVKGTNIVYGAQPFALVVTYGQNNVGVVRLDKPVYSVSASGGVGDTVKIQIEDLNGGAGPLNAVVNSKIFAEAQSETVSCALVGTALYRGKIALWLGSSSHADGRLSVDQKDTIVVTYTDASPSATNTAKALTDAIWFTISNVRAENIWGTTANIKWSTSEASGQKVYYGTTPSLGSVTQVDTPLVVNHTVRLEGLTAQTLYYFDVESEDYRGNVVRDDNGGKHYKFSTLSDRGADILVALVDGKDKDTESGEPLPDLRNRFYKACVKGGWNFDWWETSDHAGELPSRNEMKKYKAIFVPNEDEYPPFLKSQQETIKVYEQKGGRIAFSAHDFLWHAWDNSSDKNYDTLWCKNYVHARYKGDATATGAQNIYGVSGDSVTNNWTAAVSYSAHRSGATGDSMDFVRKPPDGWDPGTALSQSTDSIIWRFANSSSGYCFGSKWQSTNTHGTSGDGIWGGYKTRTIMNGFSITQMDTIKLPDILNDQFIWLIGHDHPDVTVNKPVAGNTYSASPCSIIWSFTTYSGATVDTTWIYYSDDNGLSWNLLTKSTAYTTSPDTFLWNITGYQSGDKYQVKVKVNDKNVYPSMSGQDTVGKFRINMADTLGPIVLPGTPRVSNNPILGGNPVTLSATISDSVRGLNNISAAKCSINLAGYYAFPMRAVDGAFDEVVEAVDTLLPTVAAGSDTTYTVWIRGADNVAKANRWGPAVSQTFVVANGRLTTAVTFSEFTLMSGETWITLNWRTESEIDNFQWLIDRTVNYQGENTQWTRIATLPGQGTKPTPTEYSYTDNKVEAGTVYYYRLGDMDNSGHITWHGPLSGLSTKKIPQHFALHRPYPNPSLGGQTTIRYDLPVRSRVSLQIYNIAGQLVRTLVNEEQPPDYYAKPWDGKNNEGRGVASGVYFYRLKANDFTATKKLTILR